jgi:Glycosyltransferases involved in cell wall biogenesis
MEIRNSSFSDLGKVSVICPVHNDGPFIFQTLSSILNQSYSNLEILVVDDASSDNSAEIIRSFHDPRIRFFQNETNRGAAFSRNVALNFASGMWVAFLDGDDVWLKDKLVKQLAYMVDRKIDFCYAKYSKIDEDGRPLNVVCSGPKKISRHTMLTGSYVGCLSVIYKRQLMPDLSVDPTIRKRNDYAMWLQLSRKSPCYLFNEVVACYRIHAGSLSHVSKLSLIKYHYRLFRRQEHLGPIAALLCSLQNACTFFNKRILYTRKNRTDYLLNQLDKDKEA